MMERRERDAACPNCGSVYVLLCGNDYTWADINACGCGWVWIDSHAERTPQNIARLHVVEQQQALRTEVNRDAQIAKIDAMYRQWVEQVRRALGDD